MKYVPVEGQCHGGVRFFVCILAVGFLWLAWKFEANQFWSDDLADITKIFLFAYGFTFLPGGALREFYVYIIMIMIFFGDLLQQRHHNLNRWYGCICWLGRSGVDMHACHVWRWILNTLDTQNTCQCTVTAVASQSHCCCKQRDNPGILPNDSERLCVVVYVWNIPDINLKWLGKNMSGIF